MIPKVMEAKYEYEFTIHIRFSDGTEGNVDLSQEADIAPEFLYEKVKIPTRQLL